MTLLIETVCLCLAFWGICWLGTGTDQKNLKGLSAYPTEIQKQIKADPRFSDKIKTPSPAASFLSNLGLFSVLLLPLGYLAGGNGFWQHFFHVLWMGQVLNLFDLLVIDLLWWRHTKRIRFSSTKNCPQLYHDPKNHLISFGKAIPLFVLVAGIDALLLSLLCK